MSARNNLGNALFQHGKLPEAIACFHEALRLREHFADAHYNLGLSLFEQHHAGEAIIQYERALSLTRTCPRLITTSAMP